MHKTLLAAAALVALSNSALAAEPGATAADPRNLAEMLIDQGQPAAACTLLTTAYGPQPQDPRTLLLLGRCAQGSGQHVSALNYFRRLVAQRPDSARAQAELAAAYLRLGEPAKAREHFALAQRPASPAAPVLQRLVRDLGIITDPTAGLPTAKRWQLELGSSVIYDDNVNAGPSSSTVAGTLGGVPITLRLADGSQPQSSWGANAYLTGQYLHPLSERLALLGQGSIAATHYFEEADYDNDSAAASLALLYRQGRFDASLQPSVRVQRVDGHLDETAYGLSARVGQRFGDGWRATVSAGLSARDVETNTWRDSQGWQTSLGLSRTWSPRLDTGLDYQWQREDADSDVYSRRTHGPVLFASVRPSADVSLAASYRYAWVRYDEPEFLFERRDDELQSFGLSLDWDVSRWTIRGLRLRAQHTYTQSDSTVGLYENDRNVTSLGFALRY